ncbi:MAG: Hsp20 family protein [Flavobacteriaceae bacterium]
MSRVLTLNSPYLLGFDGIERMLDRIVKSAGDGFPPYNIERLKDAEAGTDRLRITLAVAGFTLGDLDVTVEANQLVISGKQQESDARDYLHRGIAARQFRRLFLLADGIEVVGAGLENGLLSIDLQRRAPDASVRRVEIEGGRNG